MSKLDQNKTPYLDALRKYTSEDITPFDVPGHHMGNIDNPAVDLLGRSLYRLDVNAPIGLDNLAHPSGVIAESERYFAEACHADNAFFLINGTSSGILAMILTACRAGDKIILPRNVHKSVINALILSGAVPVYVMPEIDEDLEIANQPTVKAYEDAMKRYPSAKAIFVINPTYFGAVNDLKTLVELAHKHNMACLVDEAHGAHYYFHAKGAPISAMDAGADMSAVSIHKTAGSLTQSSVLLSHHGRYTRYEIQRSLNIINTTSPSGILIASLDGARQFLATKGKAAQEKTVELARYAEKEINKIPGFQARGKDYFLSHGCFDYDETKLVIELDHLDIDGYHLYHMAMERFHIQFELAETYEVLCIIAIGTKKEHVDTLVSALKVVSQEHYHPEVTYPDHHFDSKFPYMFLRPRIAFHADGKVVPLEECADCISKEQVMVYPPGIPLICPGEVWTKELVRKVEHLKEENCTFLSTYPDGFEVIDTEKWKQFSLYQKRLEEYVSSRRTTPLSDGYRMPFEGNAHRATVMLLPFRSDTWREKGRVAEKEYREVIQAIAEHEPVIVGIHPSIPNDLMDEYREMKNVTPIRIRYNDAWARDTMPLYVMKGHSIRGVDFRFNAWGGSYDGLYDNYRDDDHLSAVFDKKAKIPDYYVPDFIFEGGSIAVDGDGTAIATEACLLSPGRNPTFTKEQIEERVKEYLGVDTMIWVRHGIVEDETDEHIDNMVAFIRPGVVAMAWTEDQNDPQYEFCQETYEDLSNAVDAKGRKLEIHKILVPSPCLRVSKEEADGIAKGHLNAKPRCEGDRMAASYINFYQGKDFVVMPAFGVKEDSLAKMELQKLFPDKEIHQIYTREILLGGGNIHCITMQIPEANQ